MCEASDSSNGTAGLRFASWAPQRIDANVPVAERGKKDNGLRPRPFCILELFADRFVGCGHVLNSTTKLPFLALALDIIDDGLDGGTMGCRHGELFQDKAVRGYFLPRCLLLRPNTTVTYFSKVLSSFAES